MKRSFFVTGTDTGVGKTVVSLLVIRALFDAGHAPFYLKPVQTGCRTAVDADSDAAFVYRHTPAYGDRDPAESILCLHGAAKAPWFAARNVGRTVDYEGLVARIADLAATHSPLVVEGAGGLHVPVTDARMMIDLIKDTGTEALLVARAGLGTINHTLLSLEALSRRSVPVCGVVLVDAEDPPTPTDMIEENIEAIARFGRVPVAGPIGRITDFADLPPEAKAFVGTLL